MGAWELPVGFEELDVELLSELPPPEEEEHALISKTINIEQGINAFLKNLFIIFSNVV